MLAHLLAGALAPAFVRAWGARAFLALAVAPAAAFVWALVHAREAIEGTRIERMSWVPALGIDLTFTLGTLQWALTLVVAGIGALVLIYCAWYFGDDEPGLGALSGTLTAFAGAMLGLVWADNLLVLYVFWELTTVFSYLLIGHDPTKRSARSAGMQALIVTTFGGLAMLVGILLLRAETGTYSVLTLLAEPPSATTTVSVAVVLLLLGAVTKSALVPFHFWLPGAMAAPTPVSAYLHAAAMVKAGVFLVALLAPALAGIPGWREITLPLGVLTMLLGGWRALRQYDLKLLLAYGTVSQLGFLLTLVGIGTRSAALAGLAMVLAHALFKASLFLVVGVVDHQTGTRDLRKLSGLRRSMPVTAVAALLAGLSMAGLPPVLGFVGKESAYAAMLDVAQGGDGTGLPVFAGWLLLVGVVAGSALTVAYTARFLWGAFADKPDVEPTEVRPFGAGLAGAPVLLAGLGFVLAFLGTPMTAALEPYSTQFPLGAHDSYLALWHGLEPALALSAVSVVVGLLLFRFREGFASFQASVSPTASAERGYQASVRALDRLAVEVTGFTQRGSVGIYLAVILMVVVVLPGSALVARTSWSGTLVWWDTPFQLVLAVVTVVAAVLTARSRRRLRAIILLGVTGYVTAGLFMLHGAPDLAVTQVLVETVTIVIFVLVLRRLPEHFTDRPLARSRYWRMGIAVLVAASFAGFLLVAAGARVADPVSIGFPEAAVGFGGGKNIVNVTLVDIRAWDTFGEVAVLVVAATGVASLLFIDTRSAGIRRVHEIPYPENVQKVPTSAGRRVWLPGPRTLAPDRRSIIFEVVTRLIFHTVMLVSLYLLFAGHNNPGGGFAAGMVAGLALMVRYLAGGRYELDEAAPVDAGVVLGIGLFVAAASALAPMAFGGAVLQSAVIDLAVPVLGDIKLVTALFFDIGVFLIVFGLMLDLLRSLGAGIDRHIRREERELTETRSIPGAIT
ncbi:MAG: Na+/H+ antiporter subunit A [Nocardioides sp.]|nr:Na+/H+ antiporter subunit A [Nocardioides sp.]